MEQDVLDIPLKDKSYVNGKHEDSLDLKELLKVLSLVKKTEILMCGCRLPRQG